MAQWNENPAWIQLTDIVREQVTAEVGITDSMFNQLMENVQYCYKHLGKADIRIGTITTNTLESDQLAQVKVSERIIGDIAYLDFIFGIPKGLQGIPGISAAISAATATIDDNVGIPQIDVTLGGTSLDRTFNFAFRNCKGTTGNRGTMIYSVPYDLTSAHSVDVSELEPSTPSPQPYDFIMGTAANESSGNLFIIDSIVNNQCTLKFLVRLQGTEGPRGIPGVKGEKGAMIFYVSGGVSGAQIPIASIYPKVRTPQAEDYIVTVDDGFMAGSADFYAIKSVFGNMANVERLVRLKGTQGPPNVLSIGTVTEGTTASATITGTSPKQELNLVLPKGAVGPPGGGTNVNVNGVTQNTVDFNSDPQTQLNAKLDKIGGVITGNLNTKTLEVDGYYKTKVFSKSYLTGQGFQIGNIYGAVKVTITANQYRNLNAPNAFWEFLILGNVHDRTITKKFVGSLQNDSYAWEAKITTSGDFAVGNFRFNTNGENIFFVTVEDYGNNVTINENASISSFTPSYNNNIQINNLWQNQWESVSFTLSSGVTGQFWCYLNRAMRLLHIRCMAMMGVNEVGKVFAKLNLPAGYTPPSNSSRAVFGSDYQNDNKRSGCGIDVKSNGEVVAYHYEQPFTNGSPVPTQYINGDTLIHLV